MGGLAPWHIILLAVVALLLFGGKGKLSGFMGDAAKGIKAFKDGLKDEEHKKDDEQKPSASSPGTLPRTDAEKEAVRREEDKHTAA
jgi:sec-independent protein translocase protein TatA